MTDKVTEAVEALGRGFESFKAENEKRIKEIEKNGYASAETTAKVDQIAKDVLALQAEKTRLDDIEAKINRQGLNGGGDQEHDKAKQAHRAAFGDFFRKGRDAGLRDFEIAAKLTTQIDEDGGYRVPEEMDAAIERVVGKIAVMRQKARIQPVGSSTYKKLVNMGGATSGWVGEEQARTETATPKLKALEFATKELYAEPAITQTLLEDAEFDIGQWLEDEVGIEFAEKEAAAFINGSGIVSPRGILSYPTVANASYSWGNVGVVNSGANGAFAATDPEFALMDLRAALKVSYRSNGEFLMNDNTLLTVMKFKNSATKELLWQPGLKEGEPDMLLGKPVALDDNMPDISANSLSIGFADFRRAYIITDRKGISVIRDAYTNKPNVKFYTTKRVGGGIQNFEAIKLLKFAA